MVEVTALRIEPLDLSHLDAVLELSLRAWAPVFASLETALPEAVFQAFYPDGWETRQRDAVEAMCRDGGTLIWLASLGRQVVGYVGVKSHDEDKMGEIVIIAVDPDYQQQGIGAALTAFALERMREAGFAIAMVETGSDAGHASARYTYERAGFKRWPVARYFRAL